MSNWRKTAGVPYLKEKEYGQNAISETGSTSGADTLLHTISFGANELSVGDVITLHATFETFQSAGVNPTIRGTIDSVGNRFLSAAPGSGNRTWVVFEQFYIKNPTTLIMTDDLIQSLGGGNSLPLSVTIDITTGVDIQFYRNTNDASHRVAIPGYTVHVTR